MTDIETYQLILDFWFQELDPKQWYEKDTVLDNVMKQRFSVIHRKAAQGELYAWRLSPEGRLAEIILLDQFSRNIFRGKPESFIFDGMALALAQEAIHSGAINHLDKQSQGFILMPYMHSESLLIHEQALQLRKQYDLDTHYELLHKAIIDKFGRYPHRNIILGRVSTQEEVDFLKQDNSSF